MTFAQDISLGKHLDRCFSHLKRRQRGYSVSAKVLSFLQMIIKGGDRLSDIDLLRADPGLLALLRMEGVLGRTRWRTWPGGFGGGWCWSWTRLWWKAEFGLPSGPMRASGDLIHCWEWLSTGNENLLFAGIENLPP